MKGRVRRETLIGLFNINFKSIYIATVFFGAAAIGLNNIFYIILIYCYGSCQKPQQYVWLNSQKISVETILLWFSAETAYGCFIFFLFFLRDILLRMGKTAATSSQQ